MADLLDQSANHSLLNNSTTHLSQSDLSSTLESSSQTKGHDIDVGSYRGSIDNDSSQHLFPDDTVWAVASITGGLVVAFVLALWHHSVLEYLHGRNIADFSQRWIKGAGNGFANIFSICVGFSASSALTQMVQLTFLTFSLACLVDDCCRNGEFLAGSRCQYTPRTKFSRFRHHWR